MQNKNKHFRFIFNIFRIILFFIFSINLFTSCSKNEENDPKWISLFNGKDLTGWKVKFSGHELNDNYKNTFIVEDGILKVSYDEYENFDSKFGHIFYDKEFSNYKIRVEYRFVGEQVPSGPDWAFRNNGIMLHCQSPESMRIDQDFPVSIEAQMLGGNGTDERTTGNVCTPGTNFETNGELITNHCTSSNSKTFHGDQWVTMEVEVYADSIIKHFVNGELVLQYEKPQYDPNDADAKVILEQNSNNLRLAKGFIALQAESHPTEFRKIEILELE